MSWPCQETQMRIAKLSQLVNESQANKEAAESSRIQDLIGEPVNLHCSRQLGSTQPKRIENVNSKKRSMVVN